MADTTMAPLSAVRNLRQVCTRCAENKPLTDEFWQRELRMVTGFKKQCRVCRRLAYNLSHKKRMERPEFRARRRAICAKYMSTAEAQEAAFAYRRSAKFKESNRESNKKRKNLAERMAFSKLYQKSPSYRQIANARCSERRLTDAAFALSCRMKSRVRHALSHVGSKKNSRSWELLVGYTSSDLRSHIEARFVGAMTWENRGEWHIDHIRPLASFDFTCAEDPSFRDAWALSNLRPLWGVENASKGSLYNGVRHRRKSVLAGGATAGAL